MFGFPEARLCPDRIEPRRCQDSDLQQFNKRHRDSVNDHLVPDVIQPDLPRARNAQKRNSANIDSDRTREKIVNRDEMRGAPSPQPIRAQFGWRHCVGRSLTVLPFIRRCSRLLPIHPDLPWPLIH